jgi:hypothetical protein
VVREAQRARVTAYLSQADHNPSVSEIAEGTSLSEMDLGGDTRSFTSSWASLLARAISTNSHKNVREPPSVPQSLGLANKDKWRQQQARNKAKEALTAMQKVFAKFAANPKA